jgi:hypothetical protein
MTAKHTEAAGRLKRVSVCVRITGLQMSRRLRTSISALVLCAVLGAAAPAAAQMTAVERQRVVAHLEMTSAWLLDEISGLSPAQLAFKPSPTAWSILEVLDHLVVVGPIYWKDLQAAVAAPAKPGASRNDDDDILWYGIDRGFREQAIPGEVPKGEVRSRDAAMEAYRQNHSRLLAYARTTQDDLRAHVVPRQGSDAYQWLLLISTHEQRHVLQIRELKRHPQFPRR